MNPDSQELSSGDALAAMVEQFGQLAMSLADGSDQPLLQQRLVEFAVRGVPGAEHASLMLVTGNQRPRTVAHSDEMAHQWDQLQYRHGEGPGLVVIATNGVILAADLRTDGRWPRFASAMVDETAARGMLSVRLFLTASDRAALNLYTTRPGAFTDQSVATASMFAAYSSMALLAAARGDQVNHLTRALETNREIGVAIGILMAGGKLTQRQAFDQLRIASNTLNRKLRDIAADVTATRWLPRYKPPRLKPQRREVS